VVVEKEDRGLPGSFLIIKVGRRETADPGPHDNQVVRFPGVGDLRRQFSISHPCPSVIARGV